ncbi:TAAR [Lepeophtheirus salmonis]|uniref:TAAR n=1 Tax=Lepeophtheirus salmonis TaxID=72036 RepID=A0A0K2TTI7_LEPSM|nr:TAAR [Lepeophtheirus salmonis]CAF2852833.1 TAAR [Lepeophtheirus salmonis]
MESSNNTITDWTEGVLNILSGNGEFTNLSYGAILVVMEMSLTLISIVFNLIVIISIREKESLLNSTLNVILGNLCCSNLMAAVFVKSIAIIYNGYAVASGKWSVELAFCTVHAISSRATWAVLPYSIVVLSWLFVVHRATRILGNVVPGCSIKGSLGEDEERFEEVHEMEVCRKISEGERHSDTEDVSKDEEGTNQEIEDEEEFQGMDGLGATQKGVLAFIWFVSLVYSFLSPQIFNKKSTSCVLRDELNTNLNLISLIVMIPVPLFIGPIVCTFAQIFLTCLSCFNRSHSRVQSDNCSPPSSDHHVPHYSPATYALLFLLTLVFALGYPVNMFFVEQYLGKRETIFAFMALKYVFGYLHILLIPIFIILTRKDILNAAISVFSHKSMDAEKDNDITFEQFQTHCGMGVNPN